jgi:hypothetical protein
MRSSFLRFQASAQASRLAISRGVLSNTVSRTRSWLARRLEPVSETSTMASASSGGFTSVAPKENSISAVTPCFFRYRRVRPIASVAIRFPSRSLTLRSFESSLTASSQRTGR